jgi:hypothetical protein
VVTSDAHEAAPPKKRDVTAKANATKSVLSMNSGFQSSAALALGALSKGNASRRGKGDGVNDLSSVLEEGSSEPEKRVNPCPLHKHSTGKRDEPATDPNVSARHASPLHKHSTAKRAEPAPQAQPHENELEASKAKPERRQPGQTKSVLSQSNALQSSSAMALGSLMNKGTASRRGNSAEKGDLQSVVVGGAKGSIETVQEQPEQDAPSNAGTSQATDSKAGVSAASKPRRKGPDAKSVISGLGNSSSAASSLLGPMLQGQPKRRQKGGDMHPSSSDFTTTMWKTHYIHADSKSLCM